MRFRTCRLNRGTQAVPARQHTSLFRARAILDVCENIESGEGQTVLREVVSGVYRATAKLKVIPFVRVSSGMCVLKSENGTVLVDPFELSPDDTRTLEQIGKPSAIVLAGKFHVRNIANYRERYGCPIFAHTAIAQNSDIQADEACKDGDNLPGGLQAIVMQGTAPGETIFLANTDGGCLIAGDALMNIAPGSRIWIQRMISTPEGLGTMPKRFMEDATRAAEAYESLLTHQFEHLLVAHGDPIIGGAKAQLEAALRQTNWT